MALTEQVVLDIQSAQRQITALESQLAQLSTPVSVPVSVTGERNLSDVRRELDSADTAVGNLNRELGQTDDELRQVGAAGRRAGDDLESAGRRGASAFGRLSTAVIGIGSAVVAAQGLRAFGRFAADAINEASELEQSVGALEAVFGELGGEVAAFGETADQSVGLAASQFNQLASLLGSQLQTFGFNVADAADESQRLIGLAADLAATFGGPVSDAVEAISSLLRGEVNPIERYGVAMNQTLVNAKALELGLAATTAELSLQDQTMARLAILTEQTANAQGQFAREADTTAGRLERIRADFTNFAAAAGESLVPAFQSILDSLPEVIEMLENSLIPALAGVATEVEGIDFASFVSGLSGLPAAASTLGDAFGNVAAGAGSFAGVIASLITGDIDNLSASFNGLSDSIDQINDPFIANTAIQSLIATLSQGVAPADALESVLVQLGQSVSGLTLESFEGLATQLVAMTEAAGAGQRDLLDLVDLVTEFGEAAGFSEEGVAILVDLLTGRWRDAQREVEADRWNAMADAWRETGTAAKEVAPSMEEVAAAAQDAADKTAAAISSLDGILGDIDLGDPVTGVADLISELPSALDGAAEAMRTKEGEIRTDFTSFLDDLEGELGKRQAFSENIAALRDMGLDDLADSFADQGLEAAKLLADAVANPEEAQRAEDLLDQYAVEQANSFRETMRAELQQALDLTVPLNVTAVIQALNIRGLDGLAGDLERNRRLGSQEPTGDGGTGITNNDITINLQSSGDTSTDAAKAAQQINALIPTLN